MEYTGPGFLAVVIWLLPPPVSVSKLDRRHTHQTARDKNTARGGVGPNHTTAKNPTLKLNTRPLQYSHEILARVYQLTETIF
jgi:hypothetical protein